MTHAHGIAKAIVGGATRFVLHSPRQRVTHDVAGRTLPALVPALVVLGVHGQTQQT